MAQESSNKMTWAEFAKKYPQYYSKPKKQLKAKQQYVCQCKRGHVFDYRERAKYDSEHYAPCQGKCPVCGSPFTFIGSGVNVYPIKFNFTG